MASSVTPQADEGEIAVDDEPDSDPMGEAETPSDSLMQVSVPFAILVTSVDTSLTVTTLRGWRTPPASSAARTKLRQDEREQQAPSGGEGIAKEAPS